jgi:hypothetical protein
MSYVDHICYNKIAGYFSIKYTLHDKCPVCGLHYGRWPFSYGWNSPLFWYSVGNIEGGYCNEIGQVQEDTLVQPREWVHI